MPDPGATKTNGTICLDNTECMSDACIGIGTRRCRPSCSNTASCRLLTGFTSGHCLYTPSSGDYFKQCDPMTNAGKSALGVACTDDFNCQSDYCDGDLKKCANVCARDSDCAANESCRPSATGTPFLHCVIKP